MDKCLTGGQPERRVSQNLGENQHGGSRVVRSQGQIDWSLRVWWNVERRGTCDGQRFGCSSWVGHGALYLPWGRMKIWRTIMKSTLDWVCCVWKMSSGHVKWAPGVWVDESVTKYFLTTSWCEGPFYGQEKKTEKNLCLQLTYTNIFIFYPKTVFCDYLRMLYHLPGESET